MSAPFGSDPWLDARLRNVPLPVGMLARLNQIPQAEGGENGATPTPQIYRPVSLPPLGSPLSDEQLDAGLADVPLPPGMLARLERIGFERRPRVGLRELAMAASVLVAIGGAYAFRSMPLAITPRPAGTVESPIAAVNPPPPLEETDLLNPPAVRSPEDLATDLAAEELRWKLVQAAQLPIDMPADWISESSPVQPPRPRATKSLIFATPDSSGDSLPELQSISADDQPRGLMPPLVPGYELPFFEKYGEHPFVSPALHKDLRTVSVPLVTRSTSYQQAWRALADGKLLPRDEVYVEEFLAAVSPDFAPAAPGTVAVRTAAGPAPFAEPGTRLLQVGVQAGELASQTRPGTQFVAVVDISASMRYASRLAIVRRALIDMVGRLQANDTFTLVAVSDAAEVVIKLASREQLGDVLSAIQSLEAQHATNVGAGIELACQVSLEPSAAPGQSRRMVLFTDGLGDYRPQAIEQMQSLLADAAKQGVTLRVFNVGDAQNAPEQERLASLAQAGGGDVVVGLDVDDIRFALLETLTGRKQVVAREASLTITFNPQAVAAYRLIGHEMETLTGSAAGPTSVELRAGEAATALFELRLQPSGGDDVATVLLTWHDPLTGKANSVTQRVSRLQFAKSFAESPLSLQSAAIVGRAADVLRGSVFAGNGKSLSPVLNLAAQASPLVTEKPSMRAFLSFVEQAEKVRARSSGKR